MLHVEVVWPSKLRGRAPSIDSLDQWARIFINIHFAGATVVICPHCLYTIHEQGSKSQISATNNRHPALVWIAITTLCAQCGQWIIDLEGGDKRVRAYPKRSSKPPAPTEVPPEIAEDYNESSLVLDDSSKASAALSRRCLQNLLHSHFGINEKDLFTEIDVLLKKNILPPHLADSVDAIRKIGNLAAHPITDHNAGAIIAVEPGEAEWCLDTLEGLFDFCFVQPAKTAARKAALDARIAATKKPKT